jgi:hypothetical protein
MNPSRRKAPFLVYDMGAQVLVLDATNLQVRGDQRNGMGIVGDDVVDVQLERPP